MATKKACKVRGCKMTEQDKPMVFRGQPYCSELHRKSLERQAQNKK